MAAATQADAKWILLGPGVEAIDAAKLPASLEGKPESGGLSLLTKVLGISLKMSCTGATLTGVKLEGEGKLTNGGKAQFTGCSVTLNGKAAPENAKFISTGLPTGSVTTLALKGSIVLVSGQSRILVEPKEGETFVNANMGSECPVGELIPVRGKLYLKDSSEALTEHLVEHLVIEDSTNTDLWVLSKTAEHKATSDGSANLYLGGEHKGLEWGGGGVNSELSSNHEEELNAKRRGDPALFCVWHQSMRGMMNNAV